MQNSFGRVAYFAFIMAILVICTLHLSALTSTYWIKGKVFDERIHGGLWKACNQFTCVSILDNAQQIPGRLKATQTFMIFGLLFIGLSTLTLIWAAVRPKKFIFRILSSTFFIAALCDIIAMSCYTDLQKENVEKLPISYGWAYYVGWTVTVISFGTGLISLLHECLPPLNQNPTSVSGQHNNQVVYLAAVPNVHGYQTNYYTGNGYTTTPINYGYQTPYAGGAYSANNVVNGSETSQVKNTNLANHVINVSSEKPDAENNDRPNHAITETGNE